MTIALIRRLFIRHKSMSIDLGAILMGLAVAMYVVDVFDNHVSLAPRESEIELNETLLVSALLMVALLLFGIKHFLAGRREISRRSRAERQVRELAYQDGLTGLPNRRRFDEALKVAVASPPRAGAEHAVFLLDLNGFKQINDVYGHGVGDEALVVVAQRLLSAMRNGDMVARFGGDEFAVLATHLADVESASNIALRVIDALSSPIVTGTAIHHIGAGIGIAFVPTDAQSASEALRKADIALYRAKAERRSVARFFEEEMDARLRERHQLEAALRDAMQNGRIGTAFRPIVGLKDRRITGYEAIAEWVDPIHGPVPRERFMAIAEDSGLLHEIADHTLKQACEAAVSWPAHVHLAVNIYPSQLKDRSLTKRILATLAATGLVPSRLELQITESAMVANIEGAQESLSPLREWGVRIALDNFGTGYSTLSHLRNFKVDKVKIDRSFISGLAGDEESAGIVSALIGLGYGFGLQIAVDGIDRASLGDTLMSAGCEEGQGQLFGRSVNAQLASRLLEEEHVAASGLHAS